MLRRDRGAPVDWILDWERAVGGSRGDPTLVGLIGAAAVSASAPWPGDRVALARAGYSLVGDPANPSTWELSCTPIHYTISTAGAPADLDLGRLRAAVDEIGGATGEW